MIKPLFYTQFHGPVTIDVAGYTNGDMLVILTRGNHKVYGIFKDVTDHKAKLASSDMEGMVTELMLDMDDQLRSGMKIIS